uniref:Uncharacterized protein n=1 Tax=Ganoderma boninense TaxID=34458 RepID=A0A5K1K858_9APHY|nr:Uncharacterized protein [Ganoderma boninense]
MSDAGINTWNLISGTIGVVTVLPFIWALVWYQHPESKMAQLESAMKDTDALLRSLLEQGLLDPQRHVPHFTSHLTRYRTKMEAYREETFIVSVSWRKTLVAWARGLSKRIAILCEQVKTVRVEICEASFEQRMRLMNEDADGGVPPSLFTWRMKIPSIWERIMSLVSRTPSVETTETASQMSTTPAVDISIDDIGSAPTIGDAALTPRSSCSPHPSPRSSDDEGSPHRATPHRHHYPFRMLRTAADSREFRTITSAIRRVERDLTAQGISHLLLTQLVQTTRKHWSPASTKANRPRTRKPRGSGLGSKNVAASRDAPGQPSINSDTYTPGEETACDV